jgi:hypothetical protein
MVLFYSEYVGRLVDLMKEGRHAIRLLRSTTE